MEKEKVSLVQRGKDWYAEHKNAIAAVAAWGLYGVSCFSVCYLVHRIGYERGRNSNLAEGLIKEAHNRIYDRIERSGDAGVDVYGITADTNEEVLYNFKATKVEK